jgi:nucleoside-triphosphatase
MNVLLEGRPGVGKTTVAARLAALLQECNAVVCGFVTHELREGGRRVGFELETLEGRRAILAHVDLRGPARVGKYGVDVAAFERLALPTLAKPPKKGIVVIDELGKMELASESFCQAVPRLFDEPVEVVATVHAFRHPFTDG